MKIKKLIRKGVFETNSSSCHSLSIDNNADVLDTLYPNENGNIILKGGKFGWEEENYNDAKTKANYALLIAIGSYFDDNDIEYLENNVKYQMLKKVIEEQTGGKLELDIKSLSYSYIDHQSSDNDEMFNSEEHLKMFIFNPKSVLYTDNDNH